MNISDLNPFMNQLVKLTTENIYKQKLHSVGSIRELHISNNGDYLIWNDSDEDCKQSFVIRNVIDVEKIV